jgi:hypothetical protein
MYDGGRAEGRRRRGQAHRAGPLGADRPGADDDHDDVDHVEHRLDDERHRDDRDHDELDGDLVVDEPDEHDREHEQQLVAVLVAPAAVTLDMQHPSPTLAVTGRFSETARRGCRPPGDVLMPLAFTGTLSVEVDAGAAIPVAPSATATELCRPAASASP